VLKIACLAQVVNVISPLTTAGDKLLKHTTFYPFVLFSKLASGTALDVSVKAPHYNTKQFGDMPLLDVSASFDEANNAHAIFIVNRSQTESVTIDLNWQDRAPKSITNVYQLTGSDAKQANTFESPNNVVSVKVKAPKVGDKTATITVPPLSFTAIEAAL